MTVAVIGGGLGGLVAARDLARDGVDVQVFEASEIFGGSIRSAPFGSGSVDLGAEAFAVTRLDCLSLIDELGLADEVVYPRRSDARILIDDTTYALPESVLGLPTDLRSASVLALIGEAAAAHALRRDAETPTISLDPHVTLGHLARERMGDAVADRILTPIVGGVHAISPDLVEAEAILPGLLSALRAEGSLAGAARRLRAGQPAATVAGLRGGMTTLVAALLGDLRRFEVALMPSARVTSVRCTKHGWAVMVGGARFEADALVIAVDARTAATLLSEESAVLGDRLLRISVGDVATVALLVASTDMDRDPVGSGVLVGPEHREVHAKALTHATAKWTWLREAFGPGHHVVRLSYGRDGRVAEDLSTLPDLALRDLRLITGIEVDRYDDVAVVGWRRSMVHQRVGHGEAVRSVRAAVDHYDTLAMATAGLGGNGLAGTVAQARTVIDQLRNAQLQG